MKIYLAVYFSIVALLSFGQNIQNTNWKTTINGAEYIFEFKTDSLNLILGNEKLEISTFKTSNDSLILLDHLNSACGNINQGIYQMMFMTDTLMLSVLTDSCENRKNILDNIKLVQCLTSVSDFDPMSSIHVYPNPNIGDILFLSDQKKQMEFKIFNVQGQLIRAGSTKGKIHLDRLNLSQAQYFVKLKYDKFTNTIPFFVI
ncbi:MAG: T9SS type A sorting domain-containing protein [Saprospiraceae bacterium]|nr:T9SS type A sorting domain-containing protein [Bacteroidia bacterium]NNE14929.1 T9SS type A sorting domain-containing protein [Saprospiraceae bacterium]NNL93215.1 T9SS type A sorting domain-containing protein [Saprospiraceae bacterium]